MKTTNKIILALGIMLGAVSMESKASVLTVSNSTIAAVQYTSVQTAIAAAVDGDTLYIHGSAFTYGNIVIDKKLTLIGAGYKVTGTQNNVSTSFNDIQFTGAPSGSSFTGIGVGSLNFSNSTAAGNIHINRCYVGNFRIKGNGWVMENSACYNLYITDITALSNCIVRNNFFANGGSIAVDNSINQAGLVVDHNIIEGFLAGLSNAVFTNNVFAFSDISVWGAMSNCTFNNNITSSSVSNILPFGTNSGTGNINDVAFANLFVNAASAAQIWPTILITDWHLLNSSPGHNAASDGTDIGIYGGTMPMPNWTGVSNLIPQMTLLNINNTSLPVNGNLNVRFKARKQD